VPGACLGFKKCKNNGDLIEGQLGLVDLEHVTWISSEDKK
jgi:hypothetical protein